MFFGCSKVGVRGFGVMGLGFEVLVLGWFGVQGFGAGVVWGSRFWGFGFGVRGFGVFSGSLGKLKKSENNQVKIPF